MRWTRIFPVLMLAILLDGPGRVAAQSSSSSSGMFGNRTTGSGVSPGTSSAFGSGSPLSSLGQSGGQGTPSMNNPNGVGGQARTPGSFVGANTGQAAQQNFVGAAQANPSGGAQSGQGNFGMGGFGGGGLGGGGFGMGALIGRRLAQGGFGPGAGGNTTTTPPPVRTTLALGFEQSAAAPQQVNSAIAQHLRALPGLHWQGPVQVEIQGRTAILRGVAATEHDRDLAERVVRLEATVDQVQNQIAVAGQATPQKASPVEMSPAEHTPGADNSAAHSSAAGSSATHGSAGRSSAKAPALNSPARAPLGRIPPLPAKPGAK